MPEILRTADGPRAVNYMDYGVPLGRRSSPETWFVLRHYGRAGRRNHPRAHRLPRNWASQIDADERFERTAPTLLSTVCWPPRGADEANRVLLGTRNAWAKSSSHTMLRDQYCLAWVIGNIGTTREHVQRVWEQRMAPANLLRIVSDLRINSDPRSSAFCTRYRSNCLRRKPKVNWFNIH